MMKAIGLKKVILVLSLAALAVLMFLYSQQILGPNLKKQQRLLSSGKGEISTMTNNLNQLTDSLQRFEKEKEDFAQVRNLGFFDQQNRVEARRLITAIQRESGLRISNYTIKSAASIPSEKSREAGYKILNTDIDFKLEAIEDADIYKFIYMLNYGFPGQILIKDLSISKEMNITQPLLRKIGVGDSVPIVEATLNVSWQTMVPDETIAVSDSTGQGGLR